MKEKFRLFSGYFKVQLSLSPNLGFEVRTCSSPRRRLSRPLRRAVVRVRVYGSIRALLGRV